MKSKHSFIALVICILTLNVAVASDAPDTEQKPDLSKGKNHGVLFHIYERVYKPSPGENSAWKDVPVKLVSLPFTTALYEVPDLITSTATESVTRSPINNLRATLIDGHTVIRETEAGVQDVLRGILNPKNAAAVDGLLEITEAGINLVRTATDVVKTAVSTVAYPIFRLLGGKKSREVDLRGKRAAIVIVDTGYGDPMDFLFDNYGEQIVRYHLKGRDGYYCAIRMNDPIADEKLQKCIANIPKKDKTVDLISLRHTGGMGDLDGIADSLVARGLQPGLMMSIGCDDSTSTKTDADDTMGQMGISWAVHYYLSDVIAKRLRGIPMRQAATTAWYEGIARNAVDPVSWAAFALVGYDGSFPDIRDDAK